MKITIEIPDHEVEMIKKLMESDGNENVSNEDAFWMAHKVRKWSERCGMTISEAYFDMMY